MTTMLKILISQWLLKFSSFSKLKNMLHLKLSFILSLCNILTKHIRNSSAQKSSKFPSKYESIPAEHTVDF